MLTDIASLETRRRDEDVYQRTPREIWRDYTEDIICAHAFIPGVLAVRLSTKNVVDNISFCDWRAVALELLAAFPSRVLGLYTDRYERIDIWGLLPGKIVDLLVITSTEPELPDHLNVNTESMTIRYTPSPDM